MEHEDTYNARLCSSQRKTCYVKPYHIFIVIFYLFTGLFWRVHALEVSTSLAWFAGVTAVSTWLLALAYRNTKFYLKHRVAIRREDAVAREMTRKLADDKKMSRKEKDERYV